MSAHTCWVPSAGLPLIVHERFLAAYDFIPRNAVAVIGPEGDAGAMQSLLSMTPGQLEAKLLNVRLHCALWGFLPAGWSVRSIRYKSI